MSTFKKPSDDELRQRLSPIQYKVTQQEGTEPPFRNEYWDNKQAGIYVDIVSGEVLFSSLDKYELRHRLAKLYKTACPRKISLHTPISNSFMIRTEVRSKNCRLTPGDVLTDGPPPTGERYCMNSVGAALYSC